MDEKYFVIIHHSCDDVDIYPFDTLEEVYQCIESYGIDQRDFRIIKGKELDAKTFKGNYHAKEKQ